MKWFRSKWQALRARFQARATDASDRLKWWEEIPLGLALGAQSYVVGLWYFASIHGASDQVDLIVAIGAGLALDLIVVTTVMGRRQGRSSGWSWLTSLGAFGCSALIAIDRYGWEWHSLLHVAFPLVVFLYSQHLATPRRVGAPQASQGTPGAAEIPKQYIHATNGHAPIAALPVASSHNGSSAPLSGLLTVAHAPRYVCPHCSEVLVSKQALGAAVKNGHCPACRPERKGA